VNVVVYSKGILKDGIGFIADLRLDSANSIK